MLIIAALLFMAGADAPSVTVSVSPQPAFIESDARGQFLNFDLIIDNPASEPVDLDEVQVSVRDRNGKLVLRRFIDGNGTRPSIRTADVAEVPASGKTLVFNPFHRFDPDVDLHSLLYELKFSSKDGKRVYKASVTVQPQKYALKSHPILPLKNRLIVYDAHDFYGHHRRWDYTIPGIQQLGFHTNFMRYSYDFVPVDENGSMSSGPENENKSWFGFGQEIRAADGGVIAAVIDSRPDDRTFDPSTIAADGPMKVFGNFVVIDHGKGEFGVYGHIKQGSSRVKTGQQVRRGEVIAAVGASGSSNFPHLHYELQTGPDTNSEGLPSSFENFDRILGSQRVHVKSGLVDSGDIVESK